MRQRLLIMLCSLIWVVGAWAYDFSCDYNGKTLYFNKTSVSTCEITNGTYYSGDIVIPASVTNDDTTYTVTSIGTQAFLNCYELTSVEIPNSVTSIGNLAFCYCTELTSIAIPNTITTISEGLFLNCRSMTSFDIPDSVTSIGADAFRCCSGITSIVLPESLISIGDMAFSECRGLTSIEIPSSVTSIGNQAFTNCSGLRAFYGKFSSEDHRYLSIDGALHTFAPYGLTSYTIPNTVTSIGHWAFAYCRELSSIKVYNDNPSNIALESSVFYNVPKTSCIIYVPNGCKELYASADQWKSFKNIAEFANSISLTDGIAYTDAYDQLGVDVSYTLKFAADIWQPLYVPFNMSYDEWSKYGRVAELSCVHAYEDGRTTIEFVSVNGGELIPNVPYVFLPNTDDEVTFTCTDKTLKAAPAEGTKYIICASPRYTFKIFGNYQPVSGSTLATYGDPLFNGAYVMTTDNKFQHCSPSATLKPYRFYITREKTDNGYWGAPARLNTPVAGDEDYDVVYFMVDGEICSIADLVDDIDGNGAIYDLLGREVKNPTNGIYIQNGKKTRIH